MVRRIAVLTVVLVTTGSSFAGDWRLFRRAPAPDLGWSYYGLDGGTSLTTPPNTGKGCGVAPPVANRAIYPGPNPGVPVYTPVPGMLNTSDLYRGYPYPGLGWFGPLTPMPRRGISVSSYPN
jgi:hypothetical protein